MHAGTQSFGTSKAEMGPKLLRAAGYPCTFALSQAAEPEARRAQA